VFVGVSVGEGVSVGVSEIVGVILGVRDIDGVIVGVMVGVTPGTEFCNGKKYSAPLIETFK